MSSCRPAIFLDRDGVLNELVVDQDSGRPESPLALEDVALIDGATRAMRRFRDAGYLLVLATNQPAAAKCTTTVGALESVHERVLELLRAEGIEPDSSRMCLHHPEGHDPQLARPCSCRKPEPGMLIDAARELGIDLARSWMIGDTDADIEAGERAGCRTALVAYPGSSHKRLEAPRAEVRARDLDAVAAILLSKEGG